MRVIIITGTPGTGKTFLGKKLSRLMKFNYLHIDDVVKEFNLSEKYDRRLRTKIVDVRKLAMVLVQIIRKSKVDLAIDGHLSYYIPKKYVDLCLVTKCNLRILSKRLEIKRYPKLKIRDNLDSEIFDVCLIDALELGHKCLVIDTSMKVDLKKLNVRIMERLKRKI